MSYFGKKSQIQGTRPGSPPGKPSGKQFEQRSELGVGAVEMR